MGSSGRPKSYDSRFMQPIIPGFLTSFSIPLAYKEKLAEEGYEEAERLVLVHEMEPKKSDWKWEVEIEEGRHFKQGWEEFCEDHNLSVGEFVVFTHLRDLVFRVSVYDPATVCERQFPQFSRHPIKLNEKRDTFNHTSRRIKSLKVVETASTLLPHSKSKDSSFDVKLTSRSLKTRMNLPMAFVRSNEHFYRRCCQTKLIDGKGKSWQVKLNYSKSNGQSYILKDGKISRLGTI
ncbi:B3 domain-containing protein REM9 [Bienertia sinuspersici]